MRIVVQKHGKAIATLSGREAVAQLLGWTKGQVSKAIESGEATPDGITVDVVIERSGSPVCSYTPTTVTRFRSSSECAKVYGISRTKLRDLINSGATHSDGITTFDVPIE